MSRKEPTKHQLSSRLAYNQSTPAFLQKLKNQVAGRAQSDDDDVSYGDWEPEASNSNQRRREPLPQRPANDPGSADEDEDDERPQVVLLKEGKHLTAIQVDDERRKEKGLPPLAGPKSVKTDGKEEQEAGTVQADAKKAQPASASLSFSSGPAGARLGGTTKKRKVVTGGDEDASGSGKLDKKAKKKAKKGALLSFGDGEDG